MRACYGSNTDNIPLPMTMPAMQTKPLQDYLEPEMIERLGFQDDTFQSGSFTLYNEDGTVVREEVKKPPRTSSLFNPNEYPKQAQGEEEETKGAELERGQV